MKNLTKTILAVVATGVISCALFTQQAQAASISGAITFGGTVQLDTTSAGTASAVIANGWHFAGNTGSPYVSASDGSFTGLNGMFATFTALQWNFNSGAITAFWSVGGFTFDLTASSVSGRTVGPPGAVFVTGTGIIHKTGFDDTAGTWSFTTQDPSAGAPPVFSFSASSSTPDGGSALALLGIAMAGVEVLRRKLRKS